MLVSYSCYVPDHTASMLLHIIDMALVYFRPSLHIASIMVESVFYPLSSHASCGTAGRLADVVQSF
jgi:hypothetical protein